MSFAGLVAQCSDEGPRVPISAHELDEREARAAGTEKIPPGSWVPALVLTHWNWALLLLQVHTKATFRSWLQ